MGINIGLLFAFVPSGSPQVRLWSKQFKGQVKFRYPSSPSQKGGEEEEEAGWGAYARGAVASLLHHGHPLEQGLVGLVDGGASMHGSGISSSAAVGVAYLLALEHVNGLHLSPEENIQLDRQVERGYMGLSNGVLDPAALLLSGRHRLAVIRCLHYARMHIRVRNLSWLRPVHGAHAAQQLWLIMQAPLLPATCRPITAGFMFVRNSSLLVQDLHHELVAPPWYVPGAGGATSGAPAGEDCRPPYRIMLAFSGLRHALTQTPGYGKRVDECRLAAAALLEAAGRPEEEPLLAHGKALECTPTCAPTHPLLALFDASSQGVEAWRAGDLPLFGRLMTESGDSSIHNYECGTPVLIQLRSILLGTPGIFGARFCGAGFRGCCVALVEAGRASAAAAMVEQAYRQVQPELVGGMAHGQCVLLCDSTDAACLMPS
eukprot:jgi/Mesen1/9501/ME000633S08858